MVLWDPQPALTLVCETFWCVKVQTLGFGPTCSPSACWMKRMGLCLDALCNKVFFWCWSGRGRGFGRSDQDELNGKNPLRFSRRPNVCGSDADL